MQHIPHVVSDRLRQENEAHAALVTDDTVCSLQKQHPTAAAYVQAFLDTPEGAICPGTGSSAAGQENLDIGAGFGRSTILLASQGYRVSALEPAPALLKKMSLVQSYFTASRP